MAQTDVRKETGAARKKIKGKKAINAPISAYDIIYVASHSVQ